jgi:hypothetical protein
MVLSLILRFTFYPFFRAGLSFVHPAYRYLRRSLPLFCCVLLGVCGRNPAPVVRMAAVALAALVLDSRNFAVSPLQRIASSVGCLLLWQPGLLANPGFFWSVVATGMLVHAMTEGSEGFLARYFLLMAGMPLLVIPLGAFWSSTVYGKASVHSLALGWIWELVLIPVGYALPLVRLILPSETGDFVLRI